MQKARIYDRMVHWYLILADLRVPDLPRSTARIALAGFHQLFGSRLLSFRVAITGCIVSAALTTLAISIAVSVDSRASYLWEMADHLDAVAVLLGNLLADTITVIFALLMFRIVKKGPSWFAAIAVITQVTVAAALAAICMPLVIFVRSLLGSYELVSNFYFIALWKAMVFQLLSFYRCLLTHCGKLVDVDVMLFSSTTLLPSLAYSGVFAILLLSKGLLSLGRRLALRWCDVATESITSVNQESAFKFKPFTLLGLAFSALIAILGVIKELLLLL